MDKKPEKVGQAFHIEGDYVGFEKIKVGNVNLDQMQQMIDTYR